VDEIRFTPVRPGVFTTVLAEEQATATLVAGADRALLVDTGSSPAVGRALRQAVGRTVAQPLTTVVLTHAHWDHAFGLGAFADLDTVGHDQWASDIACAENRVYAERHGIDLATLARPGTTVSLIAARDLGGLGVEIVHLGTAHTRSDLVVVIPQAGVVVVGDLVEPGPPQLDETSSLPGWVQALDALVGLLRPDTVVIPGHGTPLNPGDVARFRSDLAPLAAGEPRAPGRAG